MKRKILILSLTFLVLALIGQYLWFFGRSGTQTINPLEKTDTSKISKLVIQNLYGKVELEKNKEGWLLVFPVKDWVDPSQPVDMIEGLKNFSLGSVVSENAAKYSQFDIDDARASRIQVFSEGNPKPLLDGFVGKNVTSYQTSYFRFATSTPVYVANGLPNLRQQAKSYREIRLLPVRLDGAKSLKISQGKLNLDLVKSSNTWEYRFSSKTVEGAFVQEIQSKISNISAIDFGAGEEKMADLGFEKPFMTVQVEVDEKPYSFIIGNKSKLLFPKAPETRFAKTEGRDTVLYVQESSVEDLIASLKNLPK